MDIVVGGLYQSALCGKFVVTEVRSSKSVDVEFVDTGYVATTRFDCIRSGDKGSALPFGSWLWVHW